jgi:hypothetical protein
MQLQILFFDSINDAVRTPDYTASSGRIKAINELDSVRKWPLSSSVSERLGKNYENNNQDSPSPLRCPKPASVSQKLVAHIEIRLKFPTFV